MAARVDFPLTWPRDWKFPKRITKDWIDRISNPCESHALSFELPVCEKCWRLFLSTNEPLCWNDWSVLLASTDEQTWLIAIQSCGD